MPASQSRRSVALIIETSNRYSRELLHGVQAFMQEGGHWSVQLSEQGRGDRPPSWLAQWSGDGIIARVENRRIERAIRQVGVPVVNVSATGLAADVPTVISDGRAVACLAAEHLIDQGFRHFGYCGDARFAWSQGHGRHFEGALQDQGFSCDHFHDLPEAEKDSLQEQERIGDWLLGLPKPVGVMACFDVRGQQVLAACRGIGMEVPNEVGVIGQHDDALLCELCDPPLSSVIPNPQEAGFRAALLLDRMMSGDKVPPQVYPISPIGVTTRASTDLVAIHDRSVAEALRFIRAHALEGIRVADVLKAVPMSRTLLERKFQRILKQSPYETIQQLRFQHAEDLLLRTNLSIAEVSDRCGFLTPEYFSASFKKRNKLSPMNFRNR